MKTTDDELIRRYRAGDQPSFELLVTRYQRPLYALVYRTLGGGPDVADLCQQAFVQAFLNLDKLERPVSFRAWLYRIAVNLAYEHQRSSTRHAPVEDVDSVDPPEDTNSPIDEVMAMEKQQLARDLLSKLPEVQRLTVYLRFYQGLKFEEIAQVLRSPIGTAKANYHHGIRRLRELTGLTVEGRCDEM